MHPVEVVERQLQFYNSHDLENFCSMYTDDVQIFTMSDSQPIVVGKAALRERYRVPFQNDKLHAAILSRMSMGNFVIDRELVSGKPEGLIEAGVVYWIEGDLIKQARFLR